MNVTRLYLTGLILLTCAGCGWQGRGGPGTLVIAVENLAFENVSCEAEEFKTFCEEGVRFTHAYTTSTLSQPALASLLTGFYPAEHGVRTNGRDYLSARFSTVAEAAAGSGSRTALFSGGAPILRKSGLSQGFETFDDNIPIGPNRFFRPAGDVVQSFKNWHEREVDKNSFFSVLYLADLQFPEVATVSDLGEVRDRSLEAQQKEVAESLQDLIRYLKGRGLWHRTHVVLAGLNGTPGSHSGEVRPMNVFSDNTQVALFLKPARRSQDLGPQWTIDKNVSLADVGRSLFEFIGARAPEPPIQDLPRISLFRLVEQAEADWNDDRLILIESAWGEWRWVSNIRYAARRRQYLYVHDQRSKLFNTLLDRLEMNPLPATDPLWVALKPAVMAFFEQNQLARWSVTDDVAWTHLQDAHQWWKTAGARDTGSQVTLPVADVQARRWQAERALQKAQWGKIVTLGETAKDSLLIYVAKQNLSQPAKRPNGRCTRFFHSQLKPSFHRDSACDDEMLVRLVEWANGDDEERRARALDSFITLYRLHKTESAIGAANYARLLQWDVSLSYPVGLTLSDLYLAMPDKRPLAETIKARLSREDKALDL
jgi:hypothetical protein